MSKLLVILAGFLVGASFAHPAAEEFHHIVSEKEHRQSAVRIHNQEVENARELEVEEPIRIPKAEILNPTVKCAEIVPDVGQAGPENHEACSAHCVQLEREYRHGRCLKGICHCGIEVVETEKHHQQKEKGHPTVRCEHIIPTSGQAGPANHDACRAHCRSLGQEFTHGECLEEICHCKAIPTPRPQVMENVPTPMPSQKEVTFKHPTVKCEHLVPLRGSPNAENHELCLIHCRSLGSEYKRGECFQGICHCHRETFPHVEAVEGHPTVRCEHIHPVSGRPGPENHEACSSHCRTVAELYLEGRCVDGICRCQMGTVVKTAPAVAVRPRQGLHSSGMKCEEIEVAGVVPYSKSQACFAHCRTLDEKYREGHCHQGMCHCQL